MTSPLDGREGHVHTMGRKDRTLRAHDNDGRATEDESDEWVMQELNYESQWEDTKDTRDLRITGKHWHNVAIGTGVCIVIQQVIPFNLREDRKKVP